MKTVLIALDYDPTAEKIAQTGLEIAKSMQAKAILIHVVADPGYYTDIAYSPIMGFNGFIYPGIDEMLEKELLKDSHEYLNRTKEHLGDPSIETVVVEGDFVESILDKSKELQVDLIVIGTHSRRGLDKLMSANTAEKLLHRSKIPMLIIPNLEESK
jgi:nucleotide-binding universal stress UspA family protein